MPGAAGTPGRGAVLVVDDEADLLELLGIYLKERLSDVDVLAAADGGKGLEVLRQHRVDLIVSDFRMPGMDGLEFLRLARDFAPAAMCVLWTSYGDPAIAERARREGVVRTIWSKELSLKEVVDRISELLRLKAAGTAVAR